MRTTLSFAFLLGHQFLGYSYWPSYDSDIAERYFGVVHARPRGKQSSRNSVKCLLTLYIQLGQIWFTIEGYPNRIRQSIQNYSVKYIQRPSALVLRIHKSPCLAFFPWPEDSFRVVWVVLVHISFLGTSKHISYGDRFCQKKTFNPHLMEGFLNRCLLLGAWQVQWVGGAL